MTTPCIRPILKKDNSHIAGVIREVLLDLGAPKVGTAYADKSLDMVAETGQKIENKAESRLQSAVNNPPSRPDNTKADVFIISNPQPSIIKSKKLAS